MKCFFKNSSLSFLKDLTRTDNYDSTHCPGYYLQTSDIGAVDTILAKGVQESSARCLFAIPIREGDKVLMKNFTSTSVDKKAVFVNDGFIIKALYDLDGNDISFTAPSDGIIIASTAITSSPTISVTTIYPVAVFGFQCPASNSYVNGSGSKGSTTGASFKEILLESGKVLSSLTRANNGGVASIATAQASGGNVFSVISAPSGTGYVNSIYTPEQDIYVAMSSSNYVLLYLIR